MADESGKGQESGREKRKKNTDRPNHWTHLLSAAPTHRRINTSASPKHEFAYDLTPGAVNCRPYDDSGNSAGGFRYAERNVNLLRESKNGKVKIETTGTPTPMALYGAKLTRPTATPISIGARLPQSMSGYHSAQRRGARRMPCVQWDGGLPASQPDTSGEADWMSKGGRIEK